MSHDCSHSTNANAVYAFDARGIAKRFRHAAIFGALSALQTGETMRFANDHDGTARTTGGLFQRGNRVAVAFIAIHGIDRGSER